MDFLQANFVLEDALEDFRGGYFEDALARLAEVVRLPVSKGDRPGAAGIMRTVRGAADKGDWKAKETKSKLYKLAGANKSAARNDDKIKKNTVDVKGECMDPETGALKVLAKLKSMKQAQSVRDPRTPQQLRVEADGAIPRPPDTQRSVRDAPKRVPSAHAGQKLAGIPGGRSPHRFSLPTKDQMAKHNADFDKYSSPRKPNSEERESAAARVRAAFEAVKTKMRFYRRQGATQ